MDSRLDLESERVSPGFFGEVDLRSKFWGTSGIIFIIIELTSGAPLARRASPAQPGNPKVPPIGMAIRSGN